MLYLFSGTDVEKSRVKFRKLATDLQKKRPEAGVFSFDAENFNETAFRELLGAGVLFGSRALVILNRVLDNEEAEAVVTGEVQTMADSENVFLVLEGKLLAPQKKKFEKYATEIFEHNLKETVVKEKEKPDYRLANAIQVGNRSEAWILYREALGKGEVPDQIFWKAIWGAKSKFRPSSAGQVVIHRKLVALYHDARRGTRDLGVGLERLLLDL